jgi:hypothetical protein
MRLEHKTKNLTKKHPAVLPNSRVLRPTNSLDRVFVCLPWLHHCFFMDANYWRNLPESADAFAAFEEVGLDNEEAVLPGQTLHFV